MFEQLNTQVLSFSKQFAESLIKANAVTVDHFEKIVDVQLKGFEDRLSTMADFVESAAVVKNAEDMRAFMPKGVAFVKTSAEKQIALNQELAAIATRTTEQLVSMAKGQFDVANDAVTKTVKSAKK
jgi:Phasin protein